MIDIFGAIILFIIKILAKILMQIFGEIIIMTIIGTPGRYIRILFTGESEIPEGDDLVNDAGLAIFDFVAGVSFYVVLFYLISFLWN